MCSGKNGRKVVFHPIEKSEFPRLPATLSKPCCVRAPTYGGIESSDWVEGGLVKVFIVDDSEVVRERLRAMLSEEKEIEIIGQAQDPFEAIEGIRRLKPDAVILDLRMPGGNGINVLRDIKKDKLVPTVIILTNYPYPQYRRECMKAGADFFFDKSTEFERIPEVFNQLVLNSRSKGKMTNQGSGNRNI